MKETQIIIIVFLILGIFAVYFFSQSTLFQEENVEINSKAPLLQPIKDDVPESKGGSLDINNLKPICARCNLSMGDKYTIEEWNNLFLEEEINKPHKLRKRKFKKYF